MKFYNVLHFLLFLALLMPSALLGATQPGPFGLLDLPAEYRSKRMTAQYIMQGPELRTIGEAEGEGCLRHFWFTFNDAPNQMHDLVLRIYVDGKDTPNVEMSVGAFFGRYHNQPAGNLDSPYMQVTTNGGYNCYFPMPFKDGMRVTLDYEGDDVISVYFQGDYHQYDEGTMTEPMRFYATHRRENPADLLGRPYLVGFGKGKGYLLGTFMGMQVYDKTDDWFHCGGDLILLDGGTDRPSILGGIGGEDFFGYAFGMAAFSNWSVGSPYYIEKPKATGGEPHVTFSAYRFFHPDPVRFHESFHFTFGARSNDIQSTLYWLQEGEPLPITTLMKKEDRYPETKVPFGKYDVKLDGERVWNIAGPFEATSREMFEETEFPEVTIDFDQKQPADYGFYKKAEGQGYPKTTTKWNRDVQSTMNFVDFRPYHRTPLVTNFFMPNQDSAYAFTEIESEEERDVRFQIIHDDWLRLWVDGELLYDGNRHGDFKTVEIPVTLKAGTNRVLIKTANEENYNMRVWGFFFDLLEEDD